MKKIDLGQTITILANIGVIGGLIFVGLELRQDQRIASTESVIAASQRQYQVTEVVGQNPEVWFKGLHDLPLSDEELLYFNEMASARTLTIFATWYSFVELGSGEHPDRWVRELALDLHTYPGLRRAWESEIARLDHTSGNELASREFDGAVAAELERFRRGGGL